MFLLILVYIYFLLLPFHISVYVAIKLRLPLTTPPEVICGVVSDPEVSNPSPFFSWNYVSYFAHYVCIPAKT